MRGKKSGGRQKEYGVGGGSGAQALKGEERGMGRRIDKQNVK